MNVIDNNFITFDKIHRNTVTPGDTSKNIQKM